jgi:uncharacterized protein with NRDE domain
MCTLILGRDVLAKRSLWIAANRDENPARPSDPPGVLVETPRVVGGRDRTAGGTWLAIRERCAVVALLNRRDPLAEAAANTSGRVGSTPPVAAPRPADRRSRGLLALDTATAAVERGAGFPRAALELAQRSFARDGYAPFSLLVAGMDEAWLLVLDGGVPRMQPIASGWHVITHAELDDPREPRTSALLAGLAAWRPGTAEEIESGLIDRLRDHGSADRTRVCIHEGSMVTVSSSIVHLDESGARYVHAEGRPCTHPFADRSSLLEGVGARRETA